MSIVKSSHTCYDHVIALPGTDLMLSFHSAVNLPLKYLQLELLPGSCQEVSPTPCNWIAW